MDPSSSSVFDQNDYTSQDNRNMTEADKVWSFHFSIQKARRIYRV